MSPKQQITDDMKAAMRQGYGASGRFACCLPRSSSEVTSVSSCRIRTVAIIEKMNKKVARLHQPVRGGWPSELADVEKFEMSVLATYMPQQLGEGETAAVAGRLPQLVRLARKTWQCGVYQAQATTVPI